LSWQAFKNNEPNPLSPWLERLQLTLAQKRLPALALHPISLPLQQLVRQQCDMPSPSAAALLPEKLSASAYNSFFACPYQFFARQMLHLSKLDELSDLPEKRDYGDWLHEILHKYHQSLLTQPDADKAALLQEISHQKFAHELEKSAAALGYFSRWQKSMPSYLAWSIDREAQGWHYVQGEQNFTRQLDWQGGTVTLRGRIDRIDHNEAGSAALLDYKTSSSASLRSKIKSHEDQQLPFYALLAAPAHAQIDDACFVALEAGQGKTESVHAVEFAQWRDELQSHIVGSLQALQRGNGLPANGVDSVCQYCDVRGLCRKGVW
jgi:ATP-dependent helicase/nuclease subunit B